jgi:hypothetical protein
VTTVWRAANFINRGDSYRCLNCKADMPHTEAYWLVSSWVDDGEATTVFGSEFYLDARVFQYLTDDELIALAQNLGWGKEKK